jgi:serine/threonine protein kinase
MNQSSSMRDLEGTTVANHYRLVRFLDEGAFGAVFLAAQLAYGVTLREVAIKVAKRPMSDTVARGVFRDALLMTQVAERSPNSRIRDRFVQVYDAGCCPRNEALAGHPYLVMELLDGSLKKALKIGRLPLTRAIEYYDQILEAMAFMHGGGQSDRAPVAHRDLKPANILLARRKDEPDVLKISDFGLAVEVDSRLGWVESGGDLAYLAPESFSHDICSPQSDVYALGLVFYEMITAESPFGEVGQHLQGSDVAQRAELRRLHLQARQLERFAALDEHEELRLRPQLIRVIRTALAIDMRDRTYNNAYELRGAWEAAKCSTRTEKKEPPQELPWEAVRHLTAEAERFFAVGDREESEQCLRRAAQINGDPSRVPDSMVVAATYRLWVESLLRRGELDEAGKVAVEGYRRRKCRSTALAMAAWYGAQHSPLEARFEQESEACRDRD